MPISFLGNHQRFEVETIRGYPLILAKLEYCNVTGSKHRFDGPAAVHCLLSVDSAGSSASDDRAVSEKPIGSSIYPSQV